MHPALSVILFTTLSGTGYGVLAWLGLNAALHANAVPRAPLLTGLGIGLVLVIAGLVASLWHLGQPQRAWRAQSQWRRSWLSREAICALGMHWRGWTPRVAGALLCVGSLGTVACTAMIYASLPPIAAWRDQAVLPVYLGYALFGGLLGCAALFALEAAA
jgi:DMSO reductase anchor subunit